MQCNYYYTMVHGNGRDFYRPSAVVFQKRKTIKNKIKIAVICDSTRHRRNVITYQSRCFRDDVRRLCVARSIYSYGLVGEYRWIIYIYIYSHQSTLPSTAGANASIKNHCKFYVAPSTYSFKTRPKLFLHTGGKYL